MPLCVLQQHAERATGVAICQQNIWILGAYQQNNTACLLVPALANWSSVIRANAGGRRASQHVWRAASWVVTGHSIGRRVSCMRPARMDTNCPHQLVCLDLRGRLAPDTDSLLRTNKTLLACCCAEDRFPLNDAEVSGSLGDVYRFVQRTLRKRPTPTMTLLGAVCQGLKHCRALTLRSSPMFNSQTLQPRKSAGLLSGCED